MLKAIFIAAALTPTIACAQPTDKPAPVYSVLAPADKGGAAPSGWGLFASMRGQSLNIRSPDSGWADDNYVRKGDVEAGFGWRRNGASALVGYQQADFGPNEDYAPTFGPHRSAHESHDDVGVIGLGFALH